MADRKVSLAEPLLGFQGSKQKGYGGAAVTPLGRNSFTRAASFSVGEEEDGTALLEWADLRIRFGETVAIDRAEGSVSRGEFLALMGPSGAGKTTLLDLLTGRLGAGTTREGTVLVEGCEFTEARVWAMSSYVPQDDVFFPHMTALESLRFVARLRLPEAVGDADVDARCARLLGEVGMGHVADVFVGGVLAGGLSIRGLSGGQRRRLSLAAGLVSQPRLLFLPVCFFSSLASRAATRRSFRFADEPTSGLDAASTLHVMELLSDLARVTRLGVCCTIHQPRAAIWAMFDRVYFLSAGRVVYKGATAGAVPWFESLGFLADGAGIAGNPADVILDLIAVDFEKPEAIFGAETIRDVDDVRRAADAFARRERDAGAATTLAAPCAAPPPVEARGAGFLLQYATLAKRVLRGHARHPGNACAKAVLTLAVCLLAAGVFGSQHRAPSLKGMDAEKYADYTWYRGGVSRDAPRVSFPGVFGLCGGPYLGPFGADSAPSLGPVDHPGTRFRDLDTKRSRRGFPDSGTAARPSRTSSSPRSSPTCRSAASCTTASSSSARPRSATTASSRTTARTRASSSRSSRVSTFPSRASTRNWRTCKRTRPSRARSSTASS